MLVWAAGMSLSQKWQDVIRYSDSPKVIRTILANSAPTYCDTYYKLKISSQLWELT